MKKHKTGNNTIVIRACSSLCQCSFYEQIFTCLIIDNTKIEQHQDEQNNIEETKRGEKKKERRRSVREKGVSFFLNIALNICASKYRKIKKKQSNKCNKSTAKVFAFFGENCRAIQLGSSLVFEQAPTRHEEEKWRSMK